MSGAYSVVTFGVSRIHAFGNNGIKRKQVAMSGISAYYKNMEAVIYARVSSTSQVTNGNGLEAQEPTDAGKNPTNS